MTGFARWPVATRSAAFGSDIAEPAAAAPAPKERFDIDEFRVEGADSLPQIEIEEAVYPFLGPNKTSDDVEKARAALEKAYHDKGFQTVGVSVPQQNAQRGFIVLKVTENRVGRLRVKNSRYFDLAKIKRNAPSLKEGTLPNFKEVTKDIVVAQPWPDRRVTPALRAGVTPGTVDVDLNVEDTLPLHGSVELNNRQSPNTTPLRQSYSLRYDNLWQLGHSMSVTYQDAPHSRNDADGHLRLLHGADRCRLAECPCLRREIGQLGRDRRRHQRRRPRRGDRRARGDHVADQGRALPHAVDRGSITSTSRRRSRSAATRSTPRSPMRRSSPATARPGRATAG